MWVGYFGLKTLSERGEWRGMSEVWLEFLLTGCEWEWGNYSPPLVKKLSKMFYLESWLPGVQATLIKYNMTSLL